MRKLFRSFFFSFFSFSFFPFPFLSLPYLSFPFLHNILPLSPPPPLFSPFLFSVEAAIGVVLYCIYVAVMVNSDKLVNLFRPVVGSCGLTKYYDFVFGGSNQVGGAF